ncbi:MAG: OmpH family outer membrane protein [Thermogutta sp.]
MFRQPFNRVIALPLACVIIAVWFVATPGHGGPGESEQSNSTGGLPGGAAWPVAVVDLGMVLESLPQFRSEQVALRADMERARSHFQNRQNVLLQQQQEMHKLSPETPEYREKMAELQQQINQLQTEFQLQQQEFYNRERQLLLGAYRQASQVVEQIAKERGLILVLRTAREPTGGSPQELLSYLGKEVIWADPQIDITQAVIVKLRQSQSNN